MSVRSPLALLAAGLAAAALALTGCTTPSSSSQDSTPTATAGLADVKVVGSPNATPTVQLATPMSVSTTQRTVLITGTGPKAALGKRVTIDYLGINGTDGKRFDSSYGLHPTSFVLSTDNNLKGLVNSLVGVPTGSRLLLALPPSDAYGLKGSPGSGIGPTDTIVLVVDLRSVEDVLTRATGTAVAPKAGLPTVKLDARGAPTITVPTTKPPTSLVVQPLIIGKGAKVAKGQRITVRYTEVLWPGGKQLDTTWNTSPATFAIGTGNVISGWDRGLVGQTVGSQILLVVPPDDGYGAAGNSTIGIRGTDTLVFVIDILDAN